MACLAATKSHHFTFAVLATMLALACMSACGGSPTSPSGSSASGPELTGTFVSTSPGAFSLTAADDPYTGLTVSVLDAAGLDTGIRVKVDSNGSFVLRGLPAGMFTVVFLDANQQEVGRFSFTEVQPNHQITIVVTMQNDQVVLMEEKRNGIGHGDVEVEGTATNVTINQNNDGTLMVKGYLVVSQTGTTAIRKGNQRLTLADISEGDRVHVKGTWQMTSGTQQQIAAAEIKLQTSASDGPGTGTGGGNTTACIIRGGVVNQGIELEGTVMSGALGSFMLQVNGNRASGQVMVTGGQLTCTGRPGSPCMLAVGNKVHVRGMLSTCSATAATVTASEVKVQK